MLTGISAFHLLRLVNPENAPIFPENKQNMIRVEILWVVKPCIRSFMVGYQRFRGPFCLHLSSGSMDLRNVGNLPQHYTASPSRRPDLNLRRRESFKSLIMAISQWH
jgi:hypothetical protein